MLKLRTNDGAIIEYSEDILRKKCRNFVTSLPFDGNHLEHFLNYLSSDSVYFQSDQINDLINFVKIAEYLDYHEDIDSFRLNHIVTITDIVKHPNLKLDNIKGEPTWRDLVRELENIQ